MYLSNPQQPEDLVTNEGAGGYERPPPSHPPTSLLTTAQPIGADSLRHLSSPTSQEPQLHRRAHSADGLNDVFTPPDATADNLYRYLADSTLECDLLCCF